MSLNYDNENNTITATSGTGSLVNFTGLGINNLVEDTSPQLGGNLDMNSFNIEGVTPTEMGYVSGVTSAIQTQLNGKAPTVHTHTESDITDLGSYLENVVEDTTPQLGADLDVNGHTFNIGASTGAANQVPTSNGAGGLSWAAPQVVADTTPQLGGDLDMNGNNITAAGPTTISPTEVSYLDGVTSNIQTQLGTKLENVVDDTTPQLGGDLDVNGNTINAGGTGTDGQVLTSDGAGGIAWESVAAGGTVQPTDGNTYNIRSASASGTAPNAEGALSIDIQTERNAATQVAGLYGIAIGRRNTASSASQALAIGWSNTCAGTSGVCIGNGNSIAGFDSDCIAIGTSNNISGGTGTTGNRHVMIGYDNDTTCNGGLCTIVGGQFNDITGGSSSSNNSIFGGNSCTITNSTDSTIGGGELNTITAGADHVIAGGRLNDITTGYLAGNVIGGGVGNTNSGGYSVCCGGDINTAGYRWTFVGGGRANSCSGDFSGIGWGTGHFVNAGYAGILCGDSCDVTANYGIAAGRRARSIHAGAIVFADGSAALDFDSIATNEFAIRASGLRLVDGNQSNGYVLTCDANGTGTWQALSGVTDTDAIHDNVAGEIIAVASKGSPVSADVLLIEDTEDSNNKKSITLAALASSVGGGTVQGTDATYDIQATNEGATAGNARGENSVDLQTVRTAATQIALGTASVIGGGSENRAQGNYSTIPGGRQNYIAGNVYDTIGGGLNNQIRDTSGGGANTVCGGDSNHIGLTDATSQWSTICGGTDHDIDGDYCFVGGGRIADVDGYACAIVCGQSCTVSGAVPEFALIVNGWLNTVSHDHATILNGKSCTVSGIQSVILGGESNQVTGQRSLVFGLNSSVGGSNCVSFGINNDITSGAACGTLSGANHINGGGNYNVICGGSGNDILTATSDYNAIVGGSENTIGGTTSDRNFIGGGNGHDLGTTHSAYYSTICGGFTHTLNAEFASILGGEDNEIQSGGDHSVICGGEDHIVNTLYSFVGGGLVNTITSGHYAAILGGRNNTITSLAHYSQASGYYADADKQGQRAHASGRFAAQGDAQTSDYVIRRAITHTHTNWTELTTDGLGDTTTNALRLKVGASWTFNAILVGSNDAQDKTLHFQIKGGIKNVGGTVTLKASVTDVIDNADDTLYEARAIADAANDALRIEVRRTTAGTAPADAIRWVAHVRTVEVLF